MVSTCYYIIREQNNVFTILRKRGIIGILGNCSQEHYKEEGVR